MNVNKYKYFFVFLTFILCFVTHFVYDLFPCFLTSILFPVNESIWEHMKMLVSAEMISGILLFIIFKKDGIFFNNYFLYLLCLFLSSILIFLIIYYPIYLIFGENFIFNVFTLFIAIYISYNVSIPILNFRNLNCGFFSFIGILLVYIIFAILTYFPLSNPLFYDSSIGSYGISEN